MDDEETNLRKAVSKAKKSFFRGREKKTKFVTRKERRKVARNDKKNKNRKLKKEVEEKDKQANPKQNERQIVKKKPKKKKQVSPSIKEKEGVPLPQEEDKVIASMEKKLKLKRKKSLPSAFINDGLDYLLEVCEPFMEDKENGFGFQDYELQQSQTSSKKPRLCDSDDDLNESIENSDQDLSDIEETNEIPLGQEDPLADESDVEAAEENMGGENDDGKEQNAAAELSSNSSERVKSATCSEEVQAKSTKYVPPHLRKFADDNRERKEQLERIRKQIKGNLNRLSEANMASIAKSMEGIYATNSRNDVNEIMIQLISDACITPNTMPERLLMENAMLIAILSQTLGNEVGANALQVFSEKFHHLHEMPDSYGHGKECNNTVHLLAHLYNFKVTDALLISDVIRELIRKFSEADIEMLLLLLRTIGPELRRDDAATLKELILEIQSKAVSHTTDSDQPRVRFMLDILTALRNNNLRKIPNYDPDIVDHARKVLRQILPGKEGACKLRISLDDLLAAKEKGRWWIVGSAWTGVAPNQTGTQQRTEPNAVFGDKLVALARQQRMTTDIKKNIFCVMMSSEDYLDAFEKLLKLNLKEKQAREIVHVLVDCCVKEKRYNPFYAYLGQKLCSFDKSHKVTFQYTLWDKFKVISTMKKSGRHNLASLFAYLLVAQSLSLSILKVVSFGTIDKESISFFKELFSILILENPEKMVRPIFTRIATQPKLSLLREGLKVFLEFFLMPRKASDSDDSQLATSTDSRRTRELIETAIAALDEVS